jgi:hypothetical protein
MVFVMARKKRTKLKRDRDRDHIAQQYLQGRTQHEIAADLGLSQQQISYDLRMVQGAWIESAIRSFALKRAEEIAKIGQLEHDYWEAWQESKAKLIEPDPVFLEGVQWCIKQRCAIYGSFHGAACHAGGLTSLTR